MKTMEKLKGIICHEIKKIILILCELKFINLYAAMIIKVHFVLILNNFM